MRLIDVENIAAEFWHLAGYSEPSPFCLEKAAYYALPLVVTRISQLLVSDVEAWLRQHHIDYRFSADCNRPLHACLVAVNGTGFVFLSDAASESEEKYSFAHELAHYFLQYWRPRRRALGYFGSSISDVLDGKRLPSLEERVHSLLSGVQLGCHVHLLSRSQFGIFGVDEVAETEDSADRLALEFLAPQQFVRTALSSLPRPLSRHAIIETLVTNFNLPRPIAIPYSLLFLPEPTVRQWFGIT